MATKLEAKRLGYLGRNSTLLGNGVVRTVIDDQGGMVPEFSISRGRGGVNAHWLPEFRDNSGRPWSKAEHERYWKVKLLYHIAGDFPCCPTFGGDCVVDGVSIPPHGWTANEEWKVEGLGAEGEGAFVLSSLKSPEPGLPLSWRKCDLMFAGQSGYYSVLRVRNEGMKPLSINLARHNTLGSPFLQAGCRISLAAERFKVATPGGEFDETGRLLLGAEFTDLKSVPLRDGGKVDVGLVPGMIGFTDLVTGAISPKLGLGWSCVVNPVLGLAYICFFPGEAGLPAGEVALGFNDLWLQYGGRTFTPWSLNEGGNDHTFCLGTENSVGAYANGLAYSLANPELLGRPTTLSVPAGGERKLVYGTALVELDKELLAQGISSIEAEEGALVLKGGKAFQRARLDGSFAQARRFEAGKR